MGKIAKKEIPLNEMVKEINKNFIIRYSFHKLDKITSLIGAGKYNTIVGREKQIEHFRKVLESKQDKVTFKIRGSLKIDFINK
ncbi:hypothetical protein [Flavobacterium soli]|uniref:hypothetical protein n=1 Tax=Flavobacterium soli TaxID=344881 RepID=UPI00040F3229|nr:hypothetical protein [Flavobacterium soli]